MNSRVNSVFILFREDGKNMKINIFLLTELLNSIFKIGWEMLKFNKTEAWVKIIQISILKEFKDEIRVSSVKARILGKIESLGL